MRIFLFVCAFIPSLTTFAISFQEAKKAASYIDVTNDGQREINCGLCHNMQDEGNVSVWANNLVNVHFNCLEANLSDFEKIRCLRDNQGVFSPKHLGIYSTGVHLEPFPSLFASVYGEDSEEYQTFLKESQMPIANKPKLSQEEWDLVFKWSMAGLPFFEELVTPYEGELTCEQSGTQQLTDYLNYRRYSSWKSRHQEQFMRSFGCFFENSSLCFLDRSGNQLFPTPAEADLPVSLLGDTFVIHEFANETDYWIRVSADGRFVGHGGNPSYIVDLNSKLESNRDRNIRINAFYDPSFFPNNKAFMFQGYETGICSQSLLEDPSTEYINFSDERCSYGSAVETPLYQAVGNSLSDEQYWAVTGKYESDSGNNIRLLQSPSASLSIHPYVYDGINWEIQEETKFTTPYEIDWNVSPSTELLISRKVAPVEGESLFLGYKLYQLTGEESLELQPIGRFCTPGLKGKFSFDERFFVNYGYVEKAHFADLGFESPDDPDFQKLLNRNSSVIYLTDLKTMNSYRLNNPKAGHRLLFPSFRADGWIYLLYYDLIQDRKHLVVNNYATLLE